MRVDNVTDPVYYPNSVEGAPAADTDTYAEHAVWAADGEMVRAAYTLHAEDDDYGQANTMVNEVLDDAAARPAGRQRRRARRGRAAARTSWPRVFEYWRNIDKAIGDRIEAATLEKRKAGEVERAGGRERPSTTRPGGTAPGRKLAGPPRHASSMAIPNRLMAVTQATTLSGRDLGAAG